MPDTEPLHNAKEFDGGALSPRDLAFVQDYHIAMQAWWKAKLEREAKENAHDV